MTAHSVSLTWDDPGDDTITGYQVLRRYKLKQTNGEFSILVEDTGSPATSYTDDTVIPGDQYVYRIKARNATGLSSKSNYLSLKIPAASLEAHGGDPPGHGELRTRCLHGRRGKLVSVKVVLSADPEREVAVPVSRNNQGDATDDDLTGVPEHVTFNAGDTVATFSVTATDDSDHGGSKSVALGFGTLPSRVSAGTNSQTTVSITDNDLPPGTETPADTDATRAGAIDLGDITDLQGTRFPKYSINGDDDVVDYFRFTLTGPMRVDLGLRQLDQNADLSLENSEGNTIKRSNKGGTNIEAITRTLLEGSYYIRVEAQESGANRYALKHSVGEPNSDKVAELRERVEEDSAEEDLDPELAQGESDDSSRDTTNDLGDSTDLNSAGSAEGTVNKADDEVDYYRFTLRNTKKVTVGLDDLDVDVSLYLEDSRGRKLKIRDSSWTSARWLEISVERGIYFIRINAAEDGDNFYTLRYRMETQRDDYARGTKTTGSVAVNSFSSGRLEFTGDRD